jgi:hypothetical protein
VSRYTWPPRVETSPDRADLRAAYNAAYEIAAPPAVLADAAAAAADAAERTDTAPRRDAVRLAPTGTSNVWVPIGPSEVLRGQASGRPRVSGRVRDLRVSGDGQRAYAATANGGVWFTSDRGVSWSPLGGWAVTANAAEVRKPANILVCGALDVRWGAAADGSGDQVHVGTGELSPWFQGTPGARLGGVGVLHLDVTVPAALAAPFQNPWKREARNLVGAGIYRLARSPSGPERLLAATSRGLYWRDGAFVEDADWARVTTGPLDFRTSDPLLTTDVLWAPAQGATPSRLWVAVVDGSGGGSNRTGVYVSENGVAGPFERVTLTGFVPGGRLGLAMAVSDPAILYVLGGGPRLWRIDGTTARRVDNVPEHLFGQTHDQSSYDLEIAVHPTEPDRVVVGGSTVRADEQWCASLFRLQVSCPGSGNCTTDFQAANQAAPATDPTFVGNDVHADVHAIRYAGSGAGLELWVGCDGGVFRSAHGGDRYTFVARNNGLAVLEAGYVACHPTHDGVLLAGTQDNGVIRRMGDSMWSSVQLGDGGGVVFHPSLPRFYVAQYTHAHWYSNGRFTLPVWRRTTDDVTVPSEESENKLSSFYSGADAIAGTSGNQALLALGTNRVWICEDWDPVAADAPTWKTLPSGRDPRAGNSNDVATDTFGGPRGRVVGVRWLDRDRLLVLCRRAVLAFSRSGTGTWPRHVLSHHEPKKNRFANDDVQQPSSPYLPPLGEWSDIAVHNTVPPHGAFYVAATGLVEFDGDDVRDFPRMDTLWYYDGAGTWHPTGLREHGGKAPAYAVVVDPDDASIVYVGTAMGVWRGVFSAIGDATPWQWTFFANGLPEAAVQDVAFFSHNGLKLLRAAVQARGVWEVDVSAAPAPALRTYLRVHAFDTRRTMPPAYDDPTSDNTLRWNMSPDIRLLPVRDAAVAPPPPPRTVPAMPLEFRGSAPAYELWVFQSALRRAHPLCRATGEWNESFSRLVREVRRDQGLSDEALIDDQLWDHVVTAENAFHPPWGDGEPTEADLHELIIERDAIIFSTSSPGPTPSMRAARVLPRDHTVFVLAHHRDSRPLPAADVNVLLLRRGLAAAEGDGRDLPVSDAWKTAVAQLLTGATVPLPDGWSVVDGRQHPHAPVDARLARTARFVFSPPAGATLLLAVVSSAADPLEPATLSGSTVRALVEGSHHFAAKTLRQV